MSQEGVNPFGGTDGAKQTSESGEQYDKVVDLCIRATCLKYKFQLTDLIDSLVMFKVGNKCSDINAYRPLSTRAPTTSTDPWNSTPAPGATSASRSPLGSRLPRRVKREDTREKK